MVSVPPGRAIAMATRQAPVRWPADDRFVTNGVARRSPRPDECIGDERSVWVVVDAMVAFVPGLPSSTSLCGSFRGRPGVVWCAQDRLIPPEHARRSRSPRSTC